MDHQAINGSLSSVPPSRRRDKPQLSCSSCRQSKVKCDRQSPCYRCQDRGLSCTYPAGHIPLARSKPAISHSALTDRLERLERMLVSLTDQASPKTRASLTAGALPVISGSAPGPSADLDATQSPDLPGPGSMRVNSEETVYVSSAHWSAILENISELRDCIQDQDQDEMTAVSAEIQESASSVTRPASMGPELFSGFVPAVSKAELVAAIPDRTVVDRLIYHYFNSFPLSSMTIHAPSFLRQYETFWADPLKVDVMWLALLYGIMCLASYYEPGLPTRSRESLNKVFQPTYLKQLTQSLILGGIDRGGPHAVEALLQYFLVEHLRRPDAITGNWLLMGMILRLALRMGYHREPSRFSSISPFQSELRRRLWTALYTADLMLSIQMGVPRMIKDGQWDTRAPLNLFDSDFDEDIEELPQSRPLAVVTTVTFQLFRFEMAKIIARISDITLTTTEDQNPCSNPAVIELDRLLRATYESIPDCMRFTSIANCPLTSPHYIMNQFSLTVLLQKGLIVLHRWHVLINGEWASPYTGSIYNRQDVDPNIVDSVRICVGAAVQMLEYQDVLYSEILPVGVFAGMPLGLTSTLSHEFLMATSVLCTCLYKIAMSVGNIDEVNVLIESDDQLRAVKKALIRAREIWQVASALSSDAGRAAEMVNALMAKLQAQPERRNHDTTFAINPQVNQSSDQAEVPNEDDFFSKFLEGYEMLDDRPFW